MPLYRFSDCQLDTDSRELVRDGAPVQVEPQVFDLLVFFLESGGRVVTKDEILDAVWQGRIVSDQALTSRVKAVRRAIGDDGASQRMIRTVHRIGYRFLGAEQAPASPPAAGPEIRFLRDGSGRSIAYAVAGTGPVVICPAWWVSNVVKDFEIPEVARFFGRLGAGLTLVRYDRPGVGLSDRDARARSLEDEVDVLARLVAEMGAPDCALFGMSMGGPTAIRYARNVPDRVRRLCLYGTYARGQDLCRREVQDVMIAAVQAHWGLGSRILAETFLPDASREALAAFARQQRDAATAETAAELLSLAYAIDVAADLPHLEAETLVLHRKKDRCVPAEAARRLASGLSKARLVLLEGSGHPPWDDGDQIADRANAFLRANDQGGRR